MTWAPPGTAADDESYSGPPPTLPPEPGSWAPAPWTAGPWHPGPWHPGPWQPAPWEAPPGATVPGSSEPPPWAQERWGPAAWGTAGAPPSWQPAPGPPAPWQPAPWQPGPWGPPAWGPPSWGPPPWGYGPPPYPPRWVPPGTPPHDEPKRFEHVMRSRNWGWWRPLLGLLLIAVLYAVAAVVTLLLGTVSLFVADGADFGATEPDMAAPGFILITNLVTAVAIPVVWLGWVALHGMRIGWSSSVLGRLRWRLLPPYVGYALITIGASIALSLAIAVAGGEEVAGPVASYGWLVVVVLLTTPLQSAAEEYLFRGYLSQAVAGWVRDPRAGAILAALVSGTLFSFAHLPADVTAFLFYFLVGLAASAVVWLTGGLEAAIALHTVNNLVIFVLAGALGEDLSSEAPAAILWFDVVLALVALAAFVALVARSRRRLRPEVHTAALDLRRPFGAVPTPAS